MPSDPASSQPWDAILEESPSSASPTFPSPSPFDPPTSSADRSLLIEYASLPLSFSA